MRCAYPARVVDNSDAQKAIDKWNKKNRQLELLRFKRAGAKAVIASLWSANDKTTEAIMVQFYQSLKKGMSKDEALRQAKLSQINSHPFFWSPFVLIGDGR